MNIDIETLVAKRSESIKCNKMPRAMFMSDKYVVANNIAMYVVRRMEGTVPIMYHLVCLNAKAFYLQQDVLSLHMEGLNGSPGPGLLPAIKRVQKMALPRCNEVIEYRSSPEPEALPVTVTQILRNDTWSKQRRHRSRSSHTTEGTSLAAVVRISFNSHVLRVTNHTSTSTRTT